MPLREQASALPNFDEIITARRGPGDSQVVDCRRGISPSRTYLDDLVEFSLNTRSFTWATIGEEHLPDPVPDWTDSDLRTHYEDNPAEFTDPEMRVSHICMAYTRTCCLGIWKWTKTPFVPSTQPEPTYTIYRSEESLTGWCFLMPSLLGLAKERLDSREIGFVELLLERRIALADVELGEVDSSDLTEEAAALLFGSSETGIFGPVESQLGPAIFRVNAVLTGRVTPFEDARDELARELALESGKGRNR